MADVNWGLLDNLQQMAPIRTATPSAGGGSAPVGNQTMDMSAINAHKQNQMDQQRLKLQQNADARAQQLQPGELRQQELQNQGLLTQEQKLQLELKKAQDDRVHTQADQLAYQKGGMDGYVKSLESHDPTTATTLKKSLEDNKKLARENGVGALKDTANIYHVIMSSKDPMATFNMMKGSLKRIDPNTPDSFKSPEELQAVAMGSMSTAMGYTEDTKAANEIAVKKASEEVKPTDLTKAQNDVDRLQTEYNSISNPNSIAGKRAKEKLDQAKQAAQNLARDKEGVMSSVVRSIGDVFSSDSDNVQNHIPFNLDQVNAELDKRQGSKQ